MCMASAADPPLPQTRSALPDLIDAAIRDAAASKRSSVNFWPTTPNNAAEFSQYARKLNEPSCSHK